MEVYLYSICECPALIDDVFQCTFPFFLIVCFNRVMEESYETIIVRLEVFFHFKCKGRNNN